MLELRIISPQENGFVQEIEWNNEELKTAIAKKMEDYKGLVFTEETIADGKKDRADLNKLRGAIDNERKRIKKMCMEPYDKFEKEVKEVLGLVDEQINAIDVQIKEVEQIKREEKRKTVQELFESIGFQKFVTLEMIWDEKWLNASVSLSKVENALLDLKANKLERRLKRLLKQLLKVILDEINQQNGTGYQISDVKFEFTRSIMMNESENIANEKTEADIQQVRINTILNMATQIGDEQTLKALCDVMDWDFDELKEQLKNADSHTAQDARTALGVILPDDPDNPDDEPVEE